MTCIAIIKDIDDKVIMAGDRRVSWDWSKSYSMPISKIIKTKEGILLGAAGDGNLSYLLTRVFKFPKLNNYKNIVLFLNDVFKPRLIKFLIENGYKDEKGLINVNEDLDTQVLIVINSHAYELLIDSRMYFELEEVPIPYAIGSGSNNILPILELKEFDKRLNNLLLPLEWLKIGMSYTALNTPSVDNLFDYIKE